MKPDNIALKSVDTVFVDCFNTVLIKKFSDKEIFVKWAEDLEKQFNISSDLIYRQYKKKNFKLCLNAFLKKGIFIENFELVLQELYNQLLNKNSSIEKEAFINSAKELFIQQEKNSLFLNEALIENLRRIKSEGIKLYLVSDYYCSGSIILDLFRYFKIDGLFDQVFVSCDLEKEKITGSIYKDLIKKLNIVPGKTLMIGDNFWSDIFMSRSCKLMSSNVKKIQNSDFDNLIKNEKLNNIFALYDGKFNFSNQAFSLFLFTKRLYEELKKNGCQNVLFMSREGQYLKKLFEYYCQQLQKTDKDFKTIKTHYFYGSRNSVMAASLRPLENEKFDLLFRFFKSMSIMAFMHSIGFSKDQINTVKENYKYNVNKFHVFFEKSRAFKALKENEVFKSIYDENRTKQSKAFALYLNSFNIDYKKEGLTFVDIGYHGTMQDLIFRFLNEEVKLSGYFIKNRTWSETNNSKLGLLSDKNVKLQGDQINKYDAFNYEQFLRADHGRVLGYELTNENSVNPIIDMDLDDAEVFENYVSPLQNQIFDKFTKIMDFAIEYPQVDIEKYCIAYYYYTVKNKSGYDYDWIIDMQDTSHDDFGIVGYFGRLFSKNLRKFFFSLKDRSFVFSNKGYIKRLLKNK